MQVLIGHKAKELVFDDGAAGGSSEDVTMQLRNFVGCGNIVILLEEEGRRIDPVSAAMQI